MKELKDNERGAALQSGAEEKNEEVVIYDMKAPVGTCTWGAARRQQQRGGGNG